MHFIPW